MNKRRAHILVLISSLLWGITFPLSKYVLTFMEAEHVGFIRYFFAALIMYFYSRVTNRDMKLTKKQLFYVCFTGFLAFYGYAYFEIKSLSYISSGVVSLFIGIIPIITIMIEVGMRKRDLNLRTIFVIVLAAIGVYIVIHKEVAIGGDIRGYLFMLFAITSWIFYLFKAVKIKLDPVVIITYQFGFASIFHFIGFAMKMDVAMNLNTNVLLILAYLVVSSTVLCYMMYFLAAKFLGAGIVSLYDNLVFIVGFISSAIFFQESMSTSIYVSFILILISVAMSLTLEIQKD